MPSLGLVTDSRRTGHQTLSGKPISALTAEVSISVLTEALRLRVWPKLVPSYVESRAFRSLQAAKMVIVSGWCPF
jgi:hypothetical protein